MTKILKITTLIFCLSAQIYAQNSGIQALCLVDCMTEAYSVMTDGTCDNDCLMDIGQKCPMSKEQGGASAACLYVTAEQVQSKTKTFENEDGAIAIPYEDIKTYIDTAYVRDDSNEEMYTDMDAALASYKTSYEAYLTDKNSVDTLLAVSEDLTEIATQMLELFEQIAYPSLHATASWECYSDCFEKVQNDVAKQYYESMVDCFGGSSKKWDKTFVELYKEENNGENPDGYVEDEDNSAISLQLLTVYSMVLLAIILI